MSKSYSDQKWVIFVPGKGWLSGSPLCKFVDDPTLAARFQTRGDARKAISWGRFPAEDAKTAKLECWVRSWHYLSSEDA
jgi:hypothetical protein